MNLAKFLWKEHRGDFLLTIALLLTHTVLNVVLLRLIGTYTSQMQSPPGSWWQFVLLALVIVGAQSGAIMLTNKISYQATTSLREKLLSRIPTASLLKLEELGSSKLATVFIEDVQRISGSIQIAINVARDMGLVLGVFAYFLWLSPKLMGIVALIIALGVVIFSVLRRRAMRHALEFRAASDRVFALFNNLLAGIKQVKTNSLLQASIVTTLRGQNNAASQSGKQMGMFFTAGIQSSLLLYFATFLIFTYARIDSRASADVLATYVIGLVIVFNPLINAAMTAQQIGMAKISLVRIRELLDQLSEHQTDVTSEHDVVAQGSVAEMPIRTLELRDLCHTYHTSLRQEFSLGPVNATVTAGECLFVVGGNGSGKTTLVKLLTGLYVPTSGGVYVNGSAIGPDRRGWLRSQLSIVFSDSCLFESLVGSEFESSLSRDGAAALEELRLNQAIDLSKPILSQVSSCSSGERKRVAMLFARLADRPIFVFDEFAADQDPGNKALFYDHMLDALKERGKIVVVVTHDDRYFDRANHILVLDRGLTPMLRHNQESGYSLPEGTPVKHAGLQVS